MKVIRVTSFVRSALKVMLWQLPKCLTRGGKYVVENASVSYNPKNGDILVTFKKEI